MDDANQRKQVLLPYVRHMLLCENVKTDAENRNRVTIEGLLSKIPSKEGRFPVKGDFSVYLQLSECRKAGQGGIRVVDGESDEEIYPGKRFQLNFSSDPLRVYGINYSSDWM